MASLILSACDTWADFECVRHVGRYFHTTYVELEQTTEDFGRILIDRNSEECKLIDGQDANMVMQSNYL